MALATGEAYERGTCWRRTFVESIDDTLPAISLQGDPKIQFSSWKLMALYSCLPS
jgi:hypothetical protein